MIRPTNYFTDTSVIVPSESAHTSARRSISNIPLVSFSEVKQNMSAFPPLAIESVSRKQIIIKPTYRLHYLDTEDRCRFYS